MKPLIKFRKFLLKICVGYQRKESCLQCKCESVCHLMSTNTLNTKIITNCIKVCNSYRAMNTLSAIIKTTQILYREIVAVCSDDHTR